jgi:hypothetical protein
MNEILDSDKELSYEYSTKSYKNFKQSLFIFFYFFIGVFILIITGLQSDLLTMIFGLPVFIAIPLSIMGFIRGIKSILYKEPNTSQMMFGLFGNLIIVGIFLSLIIANILDIVRALS